MQLFNELGKVQKFRPIQEGILLILLFTVRTCKPHPQ